MKRAPENPVHSNAIEVIDVRGLRAGYVPRTLADIMSPDLLNGKIKIVECVVTAKDVVKVQYEKYEY